MREGSRDHPLRPLLLLAAATTAGIGLALALADNAHAADRQPTVGLLPTATSLTAVAADTVTELADSILTTAPPRRDSASGTSSPSEPGTPPRRDPPTKPVSQVIEQATHVLDKPVHDASAAVTHATDAVDRVTAPLPVVGDVVDAATDLPGQIVGAAPPPARGPEDSAGGMTDVELPPPGTPPVAAGATPAGGASAASQFTPGSAREHPPLVTAGPGVHQTQHGPSVAADRKPQHPQLNGCGNSMSTASPAGERQIGALAEQWQLAPRWQESPSTGASHHGGRSSSPPPPSG